ncbi:serine/arginine-rich splicing factor 4-like [Belonocnema kinseyi]|uniref:serine/arginine-rich splicing factor 4-like n=1 Tax=Belonocnema kinseyi TaxID=2817044 RepID=UPI00143D6E74|nr:serine/arginine-rich splicing factor 4-like [Belonocnema kinseyi]
MRILWPVVISSVVVLNSIDLSVQFRHRSLVPVEGPSSPQSSHSAISHLATNSGSNGSSRSRSRSLSRFNSSSRSSYSSTSSFGPSSSSSASANSHPAPPVEVPRRPVINLNRVPLPEQAEIVRNFSIFSGYFIKNYNRETEVDNHRMFHLTSTVGRRSVKDRDDFIVGFFENGDYTLRGIYQMQDLSSQSGHRSSVPHEGPSSPQSSHSAISHSATNSGSNASSRSRSRSISRLSSRSSFTSTSSSSSSANSRPPHLVEELSLQSGNRNYGARRSLITDEGPSSPRVSRSTTKSGSNTGSSSVSRSRSRSASRHPSSTSSTSSSSSNAHSPQPVQGFTEKIAQRIRTTEKGPSKTEESQQHQTSSRSNSNAKGGDGNIGNYFQREKESGRNDTKIFQSILAIRDCMKLQGRLIRYNEWCFGQ